MALLWADGFDHYGTSTTGRSNMLLGVYADVDTGWTPSATLPRNGSYALSASAVTTAQGARRSFGAALTTVGVGGAFYWTTLPGTATAMRPFQINDAANGNQVCLIVLPSGAIQVNRGNASSGTSLGATSTQVVYNGQWNHIEMKVVAGSTTTAADGTVDVWVNGDSVLALTGVRTINTSNREYSQVSFGIYSDGQPCYIDDVFAWDSTGSYCNSQIGDKDVLTYYYDADDAVTDWVRNTGSNDYEAVDDTAQDGDTTYLEASAVNNTSKLGVGTVPSTVDDIVAVVLVNVMKKTAAGASEVSADIEESGGGVTSNTAHTLTQSYAYYHDVVHRNPVDGTTAWSYSTLSAAKLKLKRTV